MYWTVSKEISEGPVYQESGKEGVWGEAVGELGWLQSFGALEGL